MKRTILISLIAVGLIYATEQNSTVEYEHALKSTTSVESPVEDMSKMKAMGKCGADQKAGKHSTTTEETNGSAVPIEYEHELKSASSDEATSGNMSKMKAMGKCGADQKANKPTTGEETNGSTVPVDYEHALKSSSSEEGVAEDMSKMKAMGKCGGDK